MRRITMLALMAALAAPACNRASADADSGAPARNAARPPAADAANVPRDTAAASEAVREVTIPAGTELPVILDTSVGSDTSHVEMPVQAHLAQPVTLGGKTALASGTHIKGVVTSAEQSGRVKGRAHIAMRFDTLVPADQHDQYKINTAPVDRTAAATKKKDALEIGAPAAGGALIGAIAGGKKGALIGTAVGGGAGTAVVMSTRGDEVRLAKGATLRLRLTEPVTIRVRS